LTIDYTLLKPSYTYRIYDTVAALPADWDGLASENIFLSKPYLEVLEKSAPENMVCHFIGIFEQSNLKGIALLQFLDL